MKVGELYEYLEERIPSTLSLDWDNDGLACCPDLSAPVRRVLIALDPTERVVDRAITDGFDVILTHHPLMFKGIKQLNETAGVPRKLIRLIRAGVSAMAFHTRLDAVVGGVNDVLCERLGIDEAVPFGANGEEIGRIGSLTDAVTLEAFSERVRVQLDAPVVLCANAGLMVRRVAVLGGEGGDDIFAAIAAGADTYVSGRLGYHHMMDAPEMGINLIEAGHYYTEAPVCERLAQLVQEADADIETVTMRDCEILTN